jgi:hypothetical protein
MLNEYEDEDRAMMEKFEASKQPTPAEPFRLHPFWCPVAKGRVGDPCTFFSYPQDGECACGVFKHHVHCQHGFVIQVG